MDVGYEPAFDSVRTEGHARGEEAKDVGHAEVLAYRRHDRRRAEKAQGVGLRALDVRRQSGEESGYHAR